MRRRFQNHARGCELLSAIQTRSDRFGGIVVGAQDA